MMRRAAFSLACRRAARRRQRAATAGAPLLVALLALVVAPAHADQPMRLQDRFLAATEGWRKGVTALDGPPAKAPSASSTADAPLPRSLRELRVLVAPTPVPAWQAQQRLEGRTIIVSAGWLELLDELLRAEALSQQQADCFGGYALLLGERLRIARPARAVLAAAAASTAGPVGDAASAVLATSAASTAPPALPALPPPRLLAWPRLRMLVGTAEAPAGCAGIRPADLRRPGVQAVVDAGSDAVTLWLLTRQAARVGALPAAAAPVTPVAPVAPVASAASQASAASTARAAAATGAPATPSAPPPAVSMPACACSAIGPAPPADTCIPPARADARAWCVVHRHGLMVPRTLLWMEANAGLFEPASAAPLAPSP